MMHAVTGSFYLGTSGFAYDGWKHDVFYPEGLKNREMLSYYSSQLNSVEINYTFRRFPTKNSLTTWREQAADGFVFTLKANQRITHSRRLKDADDDVRDFLDLAKLLGDRLGCVLFQCPPNLQYDRTLIEQFVGFLPPGPPRFAMEFRHPSWVEARDLLRDQGIAWCVAQTDDKDPEAGDCRGSRPDTCGCARRSTRTRSSGVGRKDQVGPGRGRRRVHLLQTRGRRRESQDGEAAGRPARHRDQLTPARWQAAPNP